MTKDQYPLRLPPELRAEIQEAAKRNGRTMNAEIIFRLRVTIDHESSIPPLWPEITGG